MNTFYYFEGKIFETYDKALHIKESMGRYGFNKIDKIETRKDFDTFEDIFDMLKQQGESDFNAIELAKQLTQNYLYDIIKLLKERKE